MNFKNSLYRFNSIKRQKGASIFAIIILLVMVGMVLLSAMKVAPTYLANTVIVNAMDGMINNNDFEGMSMSEVRSELRRSLVTNNIRDFDTDNVVLNREGDDSFVDINYENRAPLFYNIDLVVSFENRFNKN